MRFLSAIFACLFTVLFIDIANTSLPVPYPNAKNAWKVSTKNLRDAKYIIKGTINKKLPYPHRPDTPPEIKAIYETMHGYYLIEVRETLKGASLKKQIRAFMSLHQTKKQMNNENTFYIHEVINGELNANQPSPTKYISTKHKKYIEAGLFDFKTMTVDQLPALYSTPSGVNNDFFLDKESFINTYQSLEHETVYEVKDAQLLKRDLIIVKSRHKSNNQTNIRIFLHHENGEIELIKYTTASKAPPTGEKAPDITVRFKRQNNTLGFYAEASPITHFVRGLGVIQFSITEDDLKPKSGPNIK
jgi:hypothetical protein